ncbi:MAG: HlyD family efflux transporter periplasmic adaptor subunit [Gemmatimonadetes bacterium]|nr:HlyD family efflux transporter periplasmic adaptor subunit [Gemmatimonadota bacterium]
MDIPRDPKPRKRKRAIQLSIAIGAIVLVTAGLRTLQPAAPSVDSATVWTDTVARGTMIRQVRGPGTLVPQQRRFITAVTAGRVEKLNLLPGTEVEPTTSLMRLSNPDVEVQLLQSQQQLSNATATLIQLRSTLQTQVLTQQGLVAQTRTQHQQAQREYETNRALHERNPELVAANELARTRDAAEELTTRLEIETSRLQVFRESIDEQVRAQEDQVERLRSIVRFNQERLASLEVPAGVGGMVADLPVEEGEWIQSGGTLARIDQPGRLKAEIRIPQTQAQDIAVGQAALIDTRNDTIQGTVTRIDPAVQNGTVTIDVTLPDELPRSARPDLSVDGNVIIDRLDDVVYMGRPAYGQANSRVGIFVLTADGTHAERRNVQLGRSSVNEIEVVEGLSPGDIVILSDMSAWDGHDRVRLRS